MSEQPNMPTVVWAEIAVTDLEKSRAFYGAVLERELQIIDGGVNHMVPLSDMDDPQTSAHLYPGTPSRDGNVIHILAPGKLEATMDRVVAAGGKVESDPIPVPVGRFFYARDLDDNCIGFFEAAA
ncbi:MAG: VOC family protein [Pseudomonadota bacterium]